MLPLHHASRMANGGHQERLANWLCYAMQRKRHDVGFATHSTPPAAE
jgi:hypothetical protein